MQQPVSFDWKIPLSDVLDTLRQIYSTRHPALASARLDLLRSVMSDDRADDFLPALGQELEALGLALIEQREEDDAIRLLIVPQAEADNLKTHIQARGWEAVAHRQEGAAAGAQAALPKPASGPLCGPEDYLDIPYAVAVAPGWACAAMEDWEGPMLTDLRAWPALRAIDGKFPARRGLLASCVSLSGVHAWIEQGPDGLSSTPYARLLHSGQVELPSSNRPGMPLPPRAAQVQRRTPEFSLGFAGDDLLLVDRGMVFLYPAYGRQEGDCAAEPTLLHTAPAQRRPVSDRSAVILTPDGRTCVLCRGQLLEFREGRLHPLPLSYAVPLLGDISHPVALGDSAIAWLEDDMLCHAGLDAGAVHQREVAHLPAGGMTLQALQGGWLLLGHWHAPHRSMDLGQLWHPASGQLLRIRHGALDLDSGIQQWVGLPGGEVVAGGQTRYARLGRFDALLGRLDAKAP
ncbi:hypothetical protein IB257_27075 [Achromobacter sp. ACM03]|uniref:DUF6630 family protein n=1 Tax=Achromobacter sp. ACM03 TaxID=2769300 RepID=UPI001784D946|nr:hypothetical protein [Achromobacter sp. ACM03]MBD9433618.1 hypothetical protein [Achromobacter sp. ACM03]